MSGCAHTYIVIRSQVADRAEEHLSDNHLKNFISIFQPIINSERRSSYINSFNDLITILEKRGYVGETDLGALQQIINLLPNPNILREIISNFQFRRDRNRIQGTYMNHGKSTMIYLIWYSRYSRGITVQCYILHFTCLTMTSLMNYILKPSAFALAGLIDFRLLIYHCLARCM
jgi:hypothetical protein